MTSDIDRALISAFTFSMFHCLSTYVKTKLGRLVSRVSLAFFSRKAAAKVEWRYTEHGEKIRLVYPSQAVLRPTKQHRKLADGVDPLTYLRKSSQNNFPSHFTHIIHAHT